MSFIIQLLALSFLVSVRADDPASLLTGMKGYQLTSGDLEFIQKMKEEKRIKKLQVSSPPI